MITTPSNTQHSSGLGRAPHTHGRARWTDLDFRTLLGARESWWEQAACSGIDVDVFYPLPNDSVTTKQALQVCGRCPIRAECLQYAVRNRETYGIWGGTTERQRGPALRGRPITSRRL